MNEHKSLPFKSIYPNDVSTLITQINRLNYDFLVLTFLRSLCNKIGFDYFRLAMFSPTSIQRPDARIYNGCPSVWVKKYLMCGYVRTDPVLRTGMRQTTPILWAQILSQCQDTQDKAGLAVMLDASDAGLKDGITIPWHGVTGHLGLLSFSTRSTHLRSEWLTVAPILLYLENYMFEAIVRIISSELPPKPLVSKRELEVCHWAAEGKQTDDIAKILGVSARTVTHHFCRIVEKLDTTNRNQAMFRVLKHGLVQLNISASKVKFIDEE